MQRVYSQLTGHYLGLIYRRGNWFVSENRAATEQWHRNEDEAARRLMAQEKTSNVVRAAA